MNPKAAYFQGYVARHDGLKLSNNPHKKGTPECQYWIDGWRKNDKRLAKQKERRSK